MSARAHESKGIASWPEEERPRERLLSCGPQALTDAELVAILISDAGEENSLKYTEGGDDLYYA
jgi:DNA repair protein RadC